MQLFPLCFPRRVTSLFLHNAIQSWYNSRCNSYRQHTCRGGHRNHRDYHLCLHTLLEGDKWNGHIWIIVCIYRIDIVLILEMNATYISTLLAQRTKMSLDLRNKRKYSSNYLHTKNSHWLASRWQLRYLIIGNFRIFSWSQIDCYSIILNKMITSGTLLVFIVLVMCSYQRWPLTLDFRIFYGTGYVIAAVVTSGHIVDIYNITALIMQRENLKLWLHVSETIRNVQVS